MTSEAQHCFQTGNIRGCEKAGHAKPSPAIARCTSAGHFRQPSKPSFERPSESGDALIADLLCDILDLLRLCFEEMCGLANPKKGDLLQWSASQFRTGNTPEMYLAHASDPSQFCRGPRPCQVTIHLFPKAREPVLNSRRCRKA